ncbi:DUF3017 domain-containing protein [Streptomyces yanii]|uniref:DUF3017 domain-containing protein n=1 Tax=Streptomyces yanii TaxID=78510 RepID=A0ABV5R115_9ACTN
MGAGTSPADPAAAADRTIPAPPGEGVTAVEASDGAAAGDCARPARGADVRRGGDSGTGPEDGPGADAGSASGADAGSAPGSGGGSAPGVGDDVARGADAGAGGGEPDSGAEGGGSDGNGSDRGPDDAVSAPAPDGAPRRSRRFPSFTRDTARPEGGGRAASGDAPAPARQWPLLAVLCTAGIGLLIVALNPFAEAFRIGTILIGAALVGGAVLRCVVPSVGMLAVRSRFTDLVTYGLLGLLIVMLALVAQPKPWLDIPFLEHAVRFTIR